MNHKHCIERKEPRSRFLSDFYTLSYFFIVFVDKVAKIMKKKNWEIQSKLNSFG